MKLETDFVKLGSLYFKPDCLQRIEAYERPEMVEPYYLEIIVLGKEYFWTFKDEGKRNKIFKDLSKYIDDVCTVDSIIL